MGRRPIAVFWLLLWVASQATILVEPLVGARTPDCRCNQRLCSCLQRHHESSLPRSHQAAGSDLPTLKTCNTDVDQVATSVYYLLSSRPCLGPPTPAAEPLPTSSLVLPVQFEELIPPPPRPPSV